MVAWGTKVFFNQKKNLNARQATNKVKRKWSKQFSQQLK
jgi:hypothetical protein